MATEFISVIKSSGGDYATLSAWEAACNADLTTTATRIYSVTTRGSGAADGAALHLWRGGAIVGPPHNHGTLRHANLTGQAMVSGISSYTNVQTNDVWSASDANQTNGYNVTSTIGSGNGDSVIAVAEIDGALSDSTACTISGWTTNATNKIIIRSKSAAKRSTSSALAFGAGVGRWTYSGTGTALTINEEYVDVEDIDIYRSDTTAAYYCILIATIGASNSLNLTRLILKGAGTTSGRCLYINDADAIVTANNSVFYTSTGTRAVALNAGTLTMNFCVCVSTATNSGGFTAPSGTTATVRNSYASALGTGAGWNSLGTLNLTTCAAADTTGDPAALDSLSVASQFVDPVIDGGEDFKLLTHTVACVNAGTDVTGVTTDIYGNTRVSGYVDVGAYEYPYVTATGAITMPGIDVESGVAEREIPATGAITLGELELDGDVTVTGVPVEITATGEITLGELELSNGVAEREITSSGAITLGELELAGQATRVITSSGAITLGELELSNGVAVRTITTSGAITLGELELTNGVAVRTVTTSGEITLGELELAGEAEREITSSGAITLGELELAGVAEREITSSGEITLGELELAGEAERELTATAEITLGELELDGDGEVVPGQGQNNASGAIELGALELAGNATREITSIGAIDLGALELEGSGPPLISCDGAITLGELELSGQATRTITTSGAITFGELELAGQATRVITSSGAITLGEIELSNGVAEREIASQGAITLGKVTVAGEAERSITCSGAITLGELELSGEVHGPVECDGAITLGELELAGQAYVGVISGIMASGAIDLDGLYVSADMLMVPTALYVNNEDVGAQSGQTNPSDITDMTPVFSFIVSKLSDADITHVEIEVSAAGDEDFSDTPSWDSGWIELVTPVAVSGTRTEDIVYARGV